jgi:aminoglycoside/choline kinase family phosphotransferase
VGVIGTDPDENKAFITLAGHFAAAGLPVPKLYAVSEDGMAYIQEDLGSAILYNMVSEAAKSGSFAEVEDLLCKTVAQLPEFQFRGGRGADWSVCYPVASFSRRMVMFDLNYFKYCFLKPSGLEFDEVRLQDEFELLAKDLLEDSGNTFLYRDFNARNVMIKDGEPYFIDFQGGRRGPIYYDVASFVWQARFRYPQWLKERMVDSYLEALKEYKEYTDADRVGFDGRLRLSVLFRTLQVLGAYGFRGLVEQKAQFIVSIAPALENLRELIAKPFEAYPYLMEVLEGLTRLPRFAAEESRDGMLEVKVYSFSYRKGIPQDMSGNGGGYVFDCRAIHNPGRYEPYKKLTGRDEPVIRFLEDDGEITEFLSHIYAIVDSHVERYVRRGFSNLMMSFGCTGGQHRSVYSAEHVARHIAEKYPQVRVRLIHREQGIEETL